MISLENITVEFERNKKITKALKKVSLKVEKGDIYGIVGYSGAGVYAGKMYKPSAKTYHRKSFCWRR